MFLEELRSHCQPLSGELAQMNKAKAAKLEWLLLQRLAPEALGLGKLPRVYLGCAEVVCLVDPRCNQCYELVDSSIHQRVLLSCSAIWFMRNTGVRF